MILSRSRKDLISYLKRSKTRRTSRMFVFLQIPSQVNFDSNKDIDDVNNALKEINEALNEKIA